MVLPSIHVHIVVASVTMALNWKFAPFLKADALIIFSKHVLKNLSTLNRAICLFARKSILLVRDCMHLHQSNLSRVMEDYVVETIYVSYTYGLKRTIPSSGWLKLLL